MQATVATDRRVNDESMAAALFDAYYPRVVRYAARRRVEDPELTASHALHQGIRWAQDRDRLRQAVVERDPKFEAYVFRCATNKVADEKRRKRFDLVPIEESHAVAEPVDEFEAVDSFDAFRGLVGHLTDAERVVIEHRFVDGMSAAEVAEATGRSIPAVRRLQYTGFLRLKGVLLTLVVLVALVATYLLVEFGQRSVPIEPVESGPAETLSIDDIAPTTVALEMTETTSRAVLTIEEDGDKTDASLNRFSAARDATPPTTAAASPHDSPDGVVPTTAPVEVAEPATALAPASSSTTLTVNPSDTAQSSGQAADTTQSTVQPTDEESEADLQTALQLIPLLMLANELQEASTAAIATDPTGAINSTTANGDAGAAVPDGGTGAVGH